MARTRTRGYPPDIKAGPPPGDPTNAEAPPTSTLESSPWDKFDWMRAVALDRRFTGAEKFILAYCAVFYVRHGEDTFHVRQDTIAERCATNARTVRRAFAGARRLGYLALARPRQRGRGHRHADEHRIVLPREIADNMSSIPDEIADNLSSIPRRNTGQDRQKYRTKSTEIPDRLSSILSEKVASDLQGNDVTESPIGSLEGSGPAGSAAAPPPCQDHPDGWDHDEPCRRCQRLREHAEAETARCNHERNEAIRKCGMCDNNGTVGLPSGRVIRCTHDIATFEALEGNSTRLNARTAAAAREARP